MKRFWAALLVCMLLVTTVFASVCNAKDNVQQKATAQDVMVCNAQEMRQDGTDDVCEPSDEILAQRARELGLEYVPGLVGEDRYYSKYGEPIYPPNDGALNTPEKVVIKAGTILTRYGRAKGSFFGNERDSFAQRSLPRTTDVRQFHKFRVRKNMPAEEAIIAPWFGQPGGGIQYKISSEIFAEFDEYLQEIEI